MAYSPERELEMQRLQQQADLNREFDNMLIQRAMQLLQGPITVLDLGCGWGNVTFDRFSHRQEVAKVIGLDINRKCISHARQQYRDKRFSFEACDLESPPGLERIKTLVGGASSPVLVFVTYVIQHLKDPDRFLKSLRQALPAKSLIVIRTGDDDRMLGYPDPQGHLANILELTKAIPEKGDRNHGSKVYSQLRQAGFEDCVILENSHVLSNLSPT